MKANVTPVEKTSITLRLQRDLVYESKQRGLDLSGLVEHHIREALGQQVPESSGKNKVTEDRLSKSLNTVSLQNTKAFDLKEFEKFCLVDLQLSDSTVDKCIGHVAHVNRFLGRIN